MVGLFDLWLAVLLSGVLVFIVSSIIHMVIPWHRGDYGKLPGEEDVLETMRKHGVNPGQYMFPCPGSMKDMGTPEAVAKYERGPVGFLSVIPSGPPAMGMNLVMWFVYSLIIGVFTAYIASLSLDAGAPYMHVFRLTSSTAILGYAVGNMVDSIWKGVRWIITIKFIMDGIVYGLLTAGVFSWLWPAA